MSYVDTQGSNESKRKSRTYDYLPHTSVSYMKLSVILSKLYTCTCFFKVLVVFFHFFVTFVKLNVTENLVFSLSC